MNKEAPTPLALAAIVAFPLSCIGMLLFLWLSFSGPLPLKPSSYQFKVAHAGGHQPGRARRGPRWRA